MARTRKRHEWWSVRVQLEATGNTQALSEGLEHLELTARDGLLVGVNKSATFVELRPNVAGPSWRAATLGASSTLVEQVCMARSFRLLGLDSQTRISLDPSASTTRDASMARAGMEAGTKKLRGLYRSSANLGQQARAKMATD